MSPHPRMRGRLRAAAARIATDLRLEDSALSIPQFDDVNRDPSANCGPRCARAALAEHPPAANVVGALASGASLIGASVGVAALLGWSFDAAALKSIFPGLAAMKANTALAFVLASVSLGLKARARAPRAADLCALAAALIGLLTLFEYASGRDLGIDQFLFIDRAASAQ